MTISEGRSLPERVGRPFTPESLADRWGCAPQHVRALVRQGKLQAFRLGGKLIRISALEVERFENPCQATDTESHRSEASSLSSGTRTAADSAVVSALATQRSPGPVLVSSSPASSETHDRTESR